MRAPRHEVDGQRPRPAERNGEAGGSNQNDRWNSRLKPTFKAKDANNRMRALLSSAAYAVSCYPDEIRIILMTSSAAVRFVGSNVVNRGAFVKMPSPTSRWRDAGDWPPDAAI